MTLYFAPLEGVTDAVFRRIHHECFPGVSKYFIPFISPTQNLAFTSRDWAAIAPENNIGVPAVPQLLAKDAALFLWAAQALCDMGYPEVNLNLGCPSGTVTAKGKGSGLLADGPALERLLDGIFEKPPIPVSIKTRIGYARVEEWDRLLDVFARYPIHELIIHPRTRAEFYRGTPHADAFAKAYGTLGMPLCYNGDLFSEADCLELTRHFPNTHALMLGRGLIANPALCCGEPLTKAALIRFHARLLSAYQEKYPPHVALGRMREIAKHFVCCFEAPEKPRKAIRKAGKLSCNRHIAKVEQCFQNLRHHQRRLNSRIWTASGPFVISISCFFFTVSAPYGFSIPARYSTGTGGIQAILLQKQNRQFMVDKRRFPWYTNRR